MGNHVQLRLVFQEGCLEYGILQLAATKCDAADRVDLRSDDEVALLTEVGGHSVEVIEGRSPAGDRSEAKDAVGEDDRVSGHGFDLSTNDLDPCFPHLSLL